MNRALIMDRLLLKPARQLRRLNWLILVVGLTLSAIVAVGVYVALHEELKSKQKEQIDVEVQNIKNQFAVAQSSILAMAVYFNVERKIARSDFEKFAEQLQHPAALRVLQYVEKIPSTERNSLEARIRQEGYSQFHFVHSDGAGKLANAPARDFNLPIVYVAPLLGNQRLRGVDLASDPIMLEAIRRAADTGAVTMSRGYRLAESGNDSVVVSIFVPVSRSSHSGFDNLLGLAVGVIDVSGLVVTSNDYNVPIVAVTDTTDGKREQLWSSAGISFNNAAYRDIKLIDRNWRVFMVPPKSNRPILSAFLVFGLGSLFILLVVAFSNQVELQAGTRLLGKRLDEQQADLKRSETTYRNLFYNAATANCELDAATGRFTRVNDRMCEMTGYSEAALLTLTFKDVTHPEDRGKTDEDMQRLLDGEIDGFVAEKRYLKRDGGQFWGLVSMRALRDEQGQARQLTKVIQDITDRKTADETKDILVRELAHRVRNNMQLVASLANKTSHSVRTVKDYQAQLLGRLQALSAAQDTLFEANWSSVKLARVVVKVLAAFRTASDKERWDIALPDVNLTAQQAQTIALAIHELATNAVRFGALSTSDGAIRLHAELREDSGHGSERTLEFTWVETGGPRVTKPRRIGFGSVMLERILAQQHGGTAELDWLPTGLRFHASLPLTGDAET